ncbi:hypothetical protein [Mesorhizobium sp. ES1-1]|uniref:hypothetical protein n=1 Tax=Mesorhizobium sp. ES1-1 TaxID=2876629 RepID=UPI001CCEDEC9|nr:hypothetical protein [Mesorhizobium sp. ES1-1]MBZ9674518.1 hypothetical protein [Mesorhizobium sp. ES1-1]
MPNIIHVWRRGSVWPLPYQFTMDDRGELHTGFFTTVGWKMTIHIVCDSWSLNAPQREQLAFMAQAMNAEVRLHPFLTG